MLFPIEYKRSQEFSIASIIEFHCNTLVSITTNWTIKSCTLNNCSTTIRLNKTISTTWSELYIPAKTLSYGTYEFSLIVTMNNLARSSASAYVAIISSSIQVNLIKLGPSMITHSRHQNLSLDPGTFSIDPDQDRFNATVSIDN